jgi:hypothetical protein
VTWRTRALMADAEALAWELIPRVIELSYIAGAAHTMFHDEMRGADDDVFRLVGHFSGYARLREVLALDVSEVMAEWAGRVSNDHWPPR